MKPEVLLAKPRSPSRSDKTLLAHTVDVTEAAEHLFGTDDKPTRLGKSWLRFFRLEETEWCSFHSALLASCLFHDWGKANEGMQAFFHRTPEGKSHFEHEHLSVLMLGVDGVERWTQQRSDIRWDVVLAAVGSHHLRFSHDSFAAETGSQHSVRVFVDHADFRDGLVPEAGRRLGLKGQPLFPHQSRWGYTSDPHTFLIEDLRDRLLARLHKQKPSALLHAVRSGLIAADAVGSALPRTGDDIATWIEQQFDPAELCDGKAVEAVVQKRIADLTARGKWQHWSTFQDDCEKLPERSLLLAPCGAGKTLGAWRWILGCVRKRPVKRVIFLYPTRATATEGFKDYVSWAPEAEASLLHATAGYDLEGMFPPADERGLIRYDATDHRLFAIRHWSKRIFSATVDQFFAFASYDYGPMCLLPLLADSVIVVDEVHSFDKKMFSALLGFLAAFDVPVLCMTATIQAGRKEQLARCMAQVYGYDQQPPDLAKLAGKDRYRVKRIHPDDVLDIIQAAASAGKRVLWVVNQVARAQEAVARLRGLAVPAICYHSRFKLNDRVKRHQETVAAIRPGQPAAVAVSTQVCEMSLDIDADVVVTEEAPITSIIQRMGRCRRGRDELAAKGPGDVLVYKPAEGERVYSETDLAGTESFLRWLEEKDAASQISLEQGLDLFGPKGTDAPSLNSFLVSGSYAMAGEDSYRDIEAFNVQAVLASEVTAYLASPKASQPGFVVPVPRKLRPAADARLPCWLFVADDCHYDSALGFHDQALR